jgi:hypothetical protein
MSLNERRGESELAILVALSQAEATQAELQGAARQAVPWLTDDEFVVVVKDMRERGLLNATYVEDAEQSSDPGMLVEGLTPAGRDDVRRAGA